MPAFASTGLGALLCATVFGQGASPAAGLKFEVASVKPGVRRPPGAAGVGGRAGSGLGGCPTSLKMDRGRIDVKCATVTMLIGYAFRFSPDRVTGPD
jgi:uncharacterized protein (TIGR03435 family)